MTLDDIIFGGVMLVLGICGASLCWMLHYSKKMDALIDTHREDLEELREQAAERTKAFGKLCVDMARALGGNA